MQVSNAATYSTTESSKEVEFVDISETGFNALSAETFMKLLITELQNQDPLEPMGNEELLNQISMMRNLQSNIELSDTLQSISNSQQLTSAAALIGRTVTGIDSELEPVTGIVQRAFVRDGETYVGIGASEVPLKNISSVDLPVES